MENDNIGWTDELLLGIPLIDNQHKALFQYMGHLYDECIKGIPKEKIITHIESLYGFCERHFANEEELMARFEYPYFKEHQQKHALELRSMHNFKLKAHNGEVDDSVLKQFTFHVTVWFQNQTLKDDKKLAQFLKDDPKFKWHLRFQKSFLYKLLGRKGI